MIFSLIVPLSQNYPPSLHPKGKSLLLRKYRISGYFGVGKIWQIDFRTLKNRKIISIETKYEIEKAVSEGILKYPKALLRS